MKEKKYGGIGRRILAALLIAMLFLTGAEAAVQPVHAAGQTKGETTFVTHNQKEHSLTLSLRDGALYVDSFPTADGYQYAFVGFKGVATVFFPISEPKPLPLPEKDGTYYLQIDLGKERTGQYVIALSDLSVTVKGGKAFFAKSPVYDQNLKEQKKAEKTKANAPQWYYTMQTLSSYFESTAEKKAFLKKLQKQAEEIVDAGDSDMEKIRKVHDWVAENIWYDYDFYYRVEGAPGYTGEVDVLKYRRTVCEGYANLTAALLRSLGIPAKVIHGYVIGGVGTPKEWTDEIVSGTRSNHAWNEAYADGRWVILDTTWDSGNRYSGGEYREDKATFKRERYFDPTLELFSMDHKMMGESENQRGYRASEIYHYGLRTDYNLTLKKGKTKKLTIKTEPDMSFINLKKDAKITYSSDNKNVATVSSTGVIKAKKAGSATITTKIKIADTTVKIYTRVYVTG